ncbi:family 43 glycosylhydrolase [Flavivirga jejuensis]|uniref:Family 43 glycosylhydrolase n=1 Tax=Flavivirga jejuensis TaxID=870487 RepID=A0ABT8WL29_9FLAO|nr:family 43 glycosylhydrolase [Flavivirga jejuensis]MDO5973823.1 family 43 glycosylhydrolase [Flavivirga jejuensis]
MKNYILSFVIFFTIQSFNAQNSKVIDFEFKDISGIGKEEGVMRRDPSDVIKIDNLYYVWYSKGKIATGYDATIWYATSKDGYDWEEQGIALDKGKEGTWEGASVFTPNILIAKKKYYLFYTGVSKPYKKGTKGYRPDSKIGVAVAKSPNGPWKRCKDNPVIFNGKNKEDFDSHLIDDACLITRDGKYYLYYKGRQLGKSPKFTQMGVAIADKPQGPYVKYENNPVIKGNHEVVVYPLGKGVGAMIGKVGPENIVRSLQYSEDGFNFSKTHSVITPPHAAGLYRPEAFTDSGKGELFEWGVQIGKGKKGTLPFIQRVNRVDVE